MTWTSCSSPYSQRGITDVRQRDDFERQLADGDAELAEALPQRGGQPPMLSLNLSQAIVQSIFQMICNFTRQLGMSVLLVEQHERAALGSSARVYFTRVGEISLKGPEDVAPAQ